LFYCLWVPLWRFRDAFALTAYPSVSCCPFSVAVPATEVAGQTEFPIATWVAGCACYDRAVTTREVLVPSLSAVVDYGVFASAAGSCP